MTKKLSTLLALSPPAEVRALVRLIEATPNDAEYKKLVEEQLSKIGDFEARKALLYSGFFASPDLWQLLMGCGCASGVKTQIVSTLLDKLMEWGLVSKHDIPNAFAPYMWNKPQIGQFLRLGIVDNILLGPSYIAQKYRQSVPAIIVDKGGVERIGSGFLVESTKAAGRLFIVTAKHNIDPGDDIQFKRFGQADDATFEAVTTNWTLHPKRDIGAIEVRVSNAPLPISLRGWGYILSKTVTLGYPTISSTDQAYLLAHGGELNAIVRSYLDNQTYLLISNIVAPGNSGGPVLDDAGLCIGMVVRALEGTYEGGVSNANAAIPSAELLAFIESIS